MTSAWEVRTLAEACEIKPAKSEVRQRLTDSDLVSFVPMEDLRIDQKFVSANQTRELSDVVGSYTYFADGDVLLAKITPCFENGKLGIARNLENGVGFGSSEYIVFRPESRLEPQWLYYYLSRDSFRAEGEARMGGAVGHKRVAKEFIENYPIPIPAPHEQRRIVAILDEAFAGITTAKANTEKTLRHAQDLVSGLTEGLFPQDGHSPGKHSLAELCESIVDCEHKTAPTQEEGIPSIRTPNIGRGVLLLDGVNRVSEATYKEWTRRAEPKPGDLILAREAPAGNVAVIPKGMRVCLGQRTVLLRPRRSVFESAYLAHLLLQRNSQKRLLAHSRGATVQHVNVKDIRDFKVASVPSLTEQKAVMEQVQQLADQENRLTELYTRKLAALDELKQSLLQRAFSGQL
ncbi:MAG: restriction endonuclease subunit S [Lysobacteraceae bacterium]|nr:MAG: restriction endonuclease subunit S [Xanthomonadaceae bacterium]